MTVKTTDIEAIIDPELRVIDAHVHLWNLNGHNYFAPQFLADVASGHRVEATVYVECGMGYTDDARIEFRPVGEMAHVLQQVELAHGSQHRLAEGILGAAELWRGAAIRPVIEAQLAAGKGRFRGIRARTAWDADPVANYGSAHFYPATNVLSDDSFADGARCLADLGLVLDVWGFHTQLDQMAALAARFPGLPIIVDHIGGPIGVGRYAGIRGEVFKDWAAGIRRLSRQPNVYIKLSGMGISRLGYSFGATGQAASSDELVAAWQPYISTCVEAFGPDRSIFASNFPVDLRVATYPMLLNAFKKMLSNLSTGDRAKVFAENARRVYKLS